MTKKVILITAVVFYIMGIAAHSYHNYLTEEKDIIKIIDLNLESSVKQALHLVGYDFHSRIQDQDSIEEDEDIDNIIKLTQFAEKFNLEFIYTVIQKNDKIYFTSSSSNDDELKNSTYVSFFTEYEDAPEELHKIFQTGETQFLVYSDKWGQYRSYFYPYIVDNEVQFVIAGDISSSYIHSLLKMNLLKSVGIGFFFLLLILPFVALLISFEKREKDKLINELYYDKQTGLPNRKSLFKEIDKSLNPIVLLGNIDSFKQYNDFYGYDIGDHIIKEISKRLTNWQKKCYSNKCKLIKIYKLQADEYAVLIDAKLTVEEIHLFTAEITLVCNGENIRYNAHDIPINITFGAAQCDHQKNQNTVQIIMARADMALKKAKTNRKHFLVYDNSMNITEEYHENIKWTKSIRFSILHDKVFPFFQPIINNATGEIEKFECLIRMIDETGELIYPTRFLDIAKKSKTYPELTHIMLKKAFETFKNTKYEFSINLSLDDIMNIETNEQIFTLLEGNKEAAQRCVFELLETENIENHPEVIDFISKVKDYNCKIAIDDFGSGYSNFSYVTALDIDYLKIDSSMIKNLVSDKNSKIVAETIVTFCRKMGIKTIAEFVYNRAIYDEVKNIGIDFSQGYYFGEPAKTINP